MTPSEEQKRKRIKVLLWAYAYEIENDSLVDDATFDRTCLEIDLSVQTDDPALDAWFAREFSPHTGQWVWKFPDRPALAALYQRSL